MSAARKPSACPPIYVNGGRRGFLLKVATGDLIRVLAPVLVDASLEK
jgi:prolyl-tRNA editing enzyme YbaK/EbsC (Cys-tRNA(Pro) deacylase)